MNKLISRPYSVASLEHKSTIFGGKNIFVVDLLIEMGEFETGIIENETGKFKKRKGVCTGFLSRLPIGGIKFA